MGYFFSLILFFFFVKNNTFKIYKNWFQKIPFWTKSYARLEQKEILKGREKEREREKFIARISDAIFLFLLPNQIFWRYF